MKKVLCLLLAASLYVFGLYTGEIQKLTIDYRCDKACPNRQGWSGSGSPLISNVSCYCGYDKELEAQIYVRLPYWFQFKKPERYLD